MSRRFKESIKHKVCLNHRQAQYERALDGLMKGTIRPEYVHERFEKLKAIK